MNTLKTQLQEDMKAAMRAKEADRLLVIRGLMAAIKQKEVDERIELNDTDVVAVIDRLVKQRKDSLSQFAAAGRQDLVDKESFELATLQTYLPQRLNAEQIQSEIAALVSELGAAGPGDMGKVMAAAKTRLSGKAEMAQVSAAVKAALQP